MVSLRRKNRDVHVTRSPRATRRANLSGLDVEPDGEDDEYEEQQQEGDQEDDYQMSDDEIEGNVRRSSRKRRAEVVDDEDDEEVDGGEDEEEEEEEEDGVEDRDDDDDAVVDEDYDDDGDANEADESEIIEKPANQPRAAPKVNRKPRPKKRGRKKLKVIVMEDGTFDEEGNPLQVENDEVVIANEDEAGCSKVDKFGNLTGGREYRIRTFKLSSDDQKLYMVSTEPARLVGFRDSYLLFKNHRALFKKTCTNEEKMDLIDRGILPNSYKSRSVNLVTARSIYREFGAKIIINGKKVIDDFWEARAIENGDVSGEYADPQELFNKNRYGNLLEGSAAGGSTPITGKALVNYQSDPTWLYQIATQTNDYNKRLYEQRNGILNGVKDPFTNLSFYPGNTQPTRAKITKIGGANQSIIFDAVFTKPTSRIVTGLKGVTKEIFEDIEDKSDIVSQQKFEQNVAVSHGT